MAGQETNSGRPGANLATGAADGKSTPAGLNIERLRQADAEITAALKGPMSNLERELLVADRRDIRAAIAKVEA